jgi:alcohol dehydrogenase class IV
MRYLLPVRAPRLARIAGLLGEDTRGLDETAAAERAIAAVDRLRHAIGVPGRIRDLGGQPGQLPGFADAAFNIKRLMLMSPRKPTRDDLLAILEAAY